MRNETKRKLEATFGGDAALIIETAESYARDTGADIERIATMAIEAGPASLRSFLAYKFEQETNTAPYRAEKAVN